MSFKYPLLKDLNLLVKGRISSEDAARQEKTAKAILRRLEDQPGIILADEVGMGKTFVALAVAASVALKQEKNRPVVIMVPSSLKDKWPRDLQVFMQFCMPGNQSSLRWGVAERSVEFLKMLDDPPERRKSIIFLTHGAMSRGVNDSWVKLALIYRTLYKRRNIEHVYRALYRFAGDLLGMKYIERDSENIWERLLNHDPKEWLRILTRAGIDPEGDANPSNNDDPVPTAIMDALWELKTDTLFEVLKNIPERESSYLKDRLAETRQAINEEIRNLWKVCLRKIDLRLPLLILDEAHHLKNQKTRIASLFHSDDAKADAEEVSRGPLQGVFERMLFLTATPFQLGHDELCSVLERFQGINWNGETAPSSGLGDYQSAIETLHQKLDMAQDSALRLEQAWGRLKTSDLVCGGQTFSEVAPWWEHAMKEQSGLSQDAQTVKERFVETKKRLKEAETCLKPWVIRHLKPKKLPRTGTDRRNRLVGRAILSDEYQAMETGLAIGNEALLPFLLAARAIACSPESRPVFSEGLASSYEAFLHTRRQRDATDTDDDSIVTLNDDSQMKWYLDQIQNTLPGNLHETSMNHPKIHATVKRVIDLWKKGEKTVVFCHYVATGRTLRQAISQGIENEIVKIAMKDLRCNSNDAFKQLDRIGDTFFSTNSQVRKAVDVIVSQMLGDFSALQSDKDLLLDVVRRNLRTPSFLTRFFPLSAGKLSAQDVELAFKSKDASGFQLKDLLTAFFRFLSERCGEAERKNYLKAINDIQTGAMRGADVAKTFGEDEIQGDRSERLMPNVRLVNGEVKQETRQRLMLTFNTPFFPEILIASSVMAEGVDLHLNCRHVIHHDLCWNPSMLEQRTGRVDRIGAKAEQCSQPVIVYLPYIAETQDEKMYRVVLDRERWFKVVMGEQLKVDTKTTDRIAERLPLPEKAAEELAFHLEAA